MNAVSASPKRRPPGAGAVFLGAAVLAGALYAVSAYLAAPNLEAQIRFLIPVEPTVFSPAEGPTWRAIDYGLTAIALLRNRGKSAIHVTALKVEGELDLDINEYVVHFGGRGSRSYQDMQAELNAKRLYRTLAWIVPRDGGPAEIGAGESERYLMFSAIEPREISTRTLTGEAQDYVGSRSENRHPKLLTGSPHLFDVVRFSDMSRTTSRLEGPRLHPAVLNGSIKVILATSEGNVPIEPDSLLAPSLTSLRDLKDAAARDLFRDTTQAGPSLPAPTPKRQF